MKFVTPIIGVVFGIMAVVMLVLLVKSGELMLLAVIVAAAGASYVAFRFWLDERLDEEDEKLDRIHGEKHA